MKISVVIPHYPYNEEINTKLKRCVNSLVGAYEILIIVNDKIGFAKAVNCGLKIASGDYICVVNNDLYIQEGLLEYIAKPEGVCSPSVNGVVQEFYGGFFCMPRWVYEGVGDFDERFEIGYYEDNDYFERIKQLNIPFLQDAKLKVVGDTSSTMKLFDRDKISSDNLKKFIDKWGRKPSNIQLFKNNN